MRQPSWVGLVVVLVMCGFAGGQTAMGSTVKVPNVTGSYAVIDHCNTGWCANNDYTGTWTIVQKGIKLTGHDNAGNQLTGTISGATAKWTLRGPTYSFVVKATFAATGKSFHGTFVDSRKASGTTKAARVTRPKVIVLP